MKDLITKIKRVAIDTIKVQAKKHWNIDQYMYFC